MTNSAKQTLNSEAGMAPGFGAIMVADTEVAMRGPFRACRIPAERTPTPIHKPNSF